MHHLVSPDSGTCTCDKARGWYQGKLETPWLCQCLSAFLTTSGQCTTCKDFFPGGCDSCQLVPEDLSFNTLLGLETQGNSLLGLPEGVYMCSACEAVDEFYDHQAKKCIKCDERV